MIHCKELKKDFSTKEEMFKELVKNENRIADLKKATIKNTDSINIFGIKDTESIKALSFVKDGYVYPIINTTNYFDSHGDVHFPNLWNKSLKDKSKKIFYVLEHELELDSVIAFPNDVNAFVKNVNWSDLGQSYNGQTQALIFEIAKDKIRIEKVAELFQEQVNFENSIRMRYINVNLAINSTSSDYEKQYALWKSRIDLVANKDIAIEAGYMWCIDEASIEKEGSLVLFGSNDATPVIYQKSEVEKVLKCDSCDEETEDFEAENGDIVCKKCGNKKKAEKSLSEIEAEQSLHVNEQLKQLLNKFN
ncbi:hypothetical protein UFOVP584_58 [uncultured Caudovirales phage]|uniref:Uncharacterized protein n=1 Tax=uncultured Caudovirales phage TaxID=2100421 RepID=A0A6J5N1L7_9CAUD|nr:hypothetical protein UFOVP304_31 [uncultured Caudovirales phage]CAB4152187.1 hypothetical protein UFOVP584_58 [uncultured Caudovirales phage]